ncbi:MAG: hypothetical protein ACYSWO_01045 [Planctomycetota bacterium]|jgi:hypothetical protein
MLDNVKSNPLRKILLLAALCACQALVSTAFAAETQRSQLSEEAHPDTVWFFVYLLDVDDIDGSEQNFAANVFVSLRWKDERLAKPGSLERLIPLKDIWHPTGFIVNEQGLVRRSLPELAEVQADGTVLYSQRYVGRFSQELLLSAFPFDEHDFTIQIIFPKYEPEELKLIPDSPPKLPSIVGGTIAEGFSLPDWQVLRFVAEERPLRIAGTDVQASGFALSFTARRYVSYYFWQVIAPLVMIVMMSWAAFWIDPSESGAQLGLAASSMLTLIAYRFVIANHLPKLPYMTRMDYFSLISTMMVFLALVEVIITSLLAHSKRTACGKKIDLFSRAAFPVVFALTSAWAFLGVNS